MPVCQSFCSQTPPPGQTPPWQTPLGRPPTPWVDTPLGQTPPSHQMATAADGTPPTGMHSCLSIGIPINFRVFSVRGVQTLDPPM